MDMGQFFFTQPNPTGNSLHSDRIQNPTDVFVQSYCELINAYTQLTVGISRMVQNHKH